MGEEVLKYIERVTQYEIIQFLGGGDNAVLVIDWIKDHGGMAHWSPPYSREVEGKNSDTEHIIISSSPGFNRVGPMHLAVYDTLVVKICDGWTEFVGAYDEENFQKRFQPE